MRLGWGKGLGVWVGGQSNESLHLFALSGSVWSSYRKSCVDMVMKWLVPESSGRYVNRMTNEALHKGGPCDPMMVGQKSLYQCQARPGAGADFCYRMDAHSGHAS